MDKIDEFLYTPVPGEAGLRRAWRQMCRNLGDAAPERFLNALRREHWLTHEAALLGLREFGWDAHANRECEGETYSVSAPTGESIKGQSLIVPRYRWRPEMAEDKAESHLQCLAHDHGFLHSGAIYALKYHGFEIQASTDGKLTYDVYQRSEGVQFRIESDFPRVSPNEPDPDTLWKRLVVFSEKLEHPGEHVP
jgi:hypothetical protein